MNCEMETWVIWLIVILMVYAVSITVTLVIVGKKAKKNVASNKERNYDAIILSTITDNKNTSKKIGEYKNELDYLKNRYKQLK